MTTATMPKVATERRYVDNSDTTCRMFRSDLFETLSHVQPWVPHVIFVPVIAVSLWAALRVQTAGQAAAWVLGGLVFWTLLEYVIHRFLFHPPEWIEEDTRRITGSLRPGEAVIPALPTLRHKFYFLVHGVHHDYPNDSTRLVMPPSVSVPLTALIFLGFRAAVGSAAPAAFAGFILGYLTYDTIHFATHHFRASGSVSKFLKKRHFRHHYADSSNDFGVSSPLWDILFGTMSREGKAPRA